MTFSVITKEGCHDLLGLSLPVPSTTSWRAKIDGKRFSGVNEIDGSFWAISLKARLVGRDFLRKLKDQWNQRAGRPKNYGQQRNWSAFEAELILVRVSEHSQSDLETLKKRRTHGKIPRKRRRLNCAILTHVSTRTV
jgi:hypothetical protein